MGAHHHINSRRCGQGAAALAGERRNALALPTAAVRRRLRRRRHLSRRLARRRLRGKGAHAALLSGGGHARPGAPESRHTGGGVAAEVQPGGEVRRQAAHDACQTGGAWRNGKLRCRQRSDAADAAVGGQADRFCVVQQRRRDLRHRVDFQPHGWGGQAREQVLLQGTHAGAVSHSFPESSRRLLPGPSEVDCDAKQGCRAWLAAGCLARGFHHAEDLAARPAVGLPRRMHRLVQQLAAALPAPPGEAKTTGCPTQPAGGVAQLPALPGELGVDGG